MATIVSIWLALVLALTAALKARRPARAAAALATYGILAAPLQSAALWTLVAIEAALAVALCASASWAAAAAAGLFAAFTIATAAALVAGRAGRPCACFGGTARLSWTSPARAAALSLVATAIALGILPSAPSGYDRWLTLTLSLALTAMAGLAVAILALAREVGVLRLSAGSRGALEIPEEGPPLGARQSWAPAVPAGPATALGLAVFTSDGCPLCAMVAPAVQHVAADPLLAVRIFDEHADAPVWRAAGVPGSPYAVALSADGVALAKGTFNSLGQLESVLATARVRQPGMALAA
ncbi:MAG TPA: MauE/DoxX family redox-associated membrane protein [Solirubrobacteraceae bacterium]|nr:MauE/DoxX family redox-associated membrane protein [Solirubrobacteraceae bacterium]